MLLDVFLDLLYGFAVLLLSGYITLLLSRHARAELSGLLAFDPIAVPGLSVLGFPILSSDGRL